MMLVVTRRSEVERQDSHLPRCIVPSKEKEQSEGGEDHPRLYLGGLTSAFVCLVLQY